MSWIAGLTLWLGDSAAWAQWVERLPPVIPPTSPLASAPAQPATVPWPPADYAQLPQSPTSAPAALTAYLDPNSGSPTPQGGLDEESAATPQLPSGAKQGVLQRIYFVNSWLSGRAADDIEMFDTELRVSLGFPFPTVASPLVVSPGFGAHWIDGPDAPDLPARVFDNYVDLMWKLPVTNDLKLDLAVTPGWYSDFEQGNSDALRIGARAIGFYTWSPTTRFVLGLLFLDRKDIDFLPVGGVIYHPNDDWQFDLVFPKPRIAWRYGCEGEFSSWWYVGGEFGGGSWAIARASGQPDVVNYTDWRISVGQEIRRNTDSIAWIELGYVFNRKVSYNSDTPDFEPDNTVMLRVGLGY
jgi:hypothetical protein